MFYVQSTDPAGWVYVVRQRMAVRMRQGRMDAREIAFLEDTLFPAMDRYLELCEQLAEENEANAVDHAVELR